MHDVDWGATEIAAWVALAYAASMGPGVSTLIWGTPGEQVPRQRLIRETDLLVGRQVSSGGWPSIARPSRLETPALIRRSWPSGRSWRRRTGKYMTDLAARPTTRRSEGTAVVARKFVLELQLGSQFMSSNAVGAYSLTTDQVLFVLDKANPNFPFLKGDERLVHARKSFLGRRQPRAPGNRCALPRARAKTRSPIRRYWANSDDGIGSTVRECNEICYCDWEFRRGRK